MHLVAMPLKKVMSRLPLLLPALVFWLLAPVGAVLGSDAALQKALQDAGCITPGSIKKLWSQDELVAYEVNCSGTSHRIVMVTCDPNTCRVTEPRQDQDD